MKKIKIYTTQGQLSLEEIVEYAWPQNGWMVVKYKNGISYLSPNNYSQIIVEDVKEEV